MNTVERVAELERAVTAAQAEITALRASQPPVDPPAPRPADPDKNRPLVTILALDTKFVRPTARELRELYTIVLTKYPQLGPYKSVANPIASVSDSEHYDGFVAAFEYLGHVRRAVEPDHRFYVTHFVEEAKDWLKPAPSRSIDGKHGELRIDAALGMA
jgi:hypothetical protein